jgi:LuxR family maltose regulon positive regulatory protein
MNAIASPMLPPYAGGEVVSLEQARARRHAAARAQMLTERERAVLAELAKGNPTEDIAKELFLSPHTVRSHVKASLRKLDARTRAHAVAIALAAGVIDFA